MKQEIENLKTAAENGDAKAQFELGCAYKEGENVPKNLTLAVEWLKKAAENGSAKALFELGCMYEDGEGVEKDVSKAYEYYMDAALLEEESSPEQCIFTENLKPKKESKPQYAFGPNSFRKYLIGKINYHIPSLLWDLINEAIDIYLSVEASIDDIFYTQYCRQSVCQYLSKRGVIYDPDKIREIVHHFYNFSNLFISESDKDKCVKKNEIVLLSESLQHYENITDILDKYSIHYFRLYNYRNDWARDYLPIELPSGGYATYRYNPDYLRKYKSHQSEIIDWEDCIGSIYMDRKDGLKDIVIDGGNVVRCGNYVVMTAKVFEENPGYTHAKLTSLIEETLQAQLIVLPWDTKEIFGHADGILRYVGDNTVLMTNYRQFDRKMADRFVNCLQPYFNVKELSYDVEHLDKRSWAYINWLQTEKVLIVPKLNIPEDEQAFAQISNTFPAYRGRIEMADATEIVKKGGGFNCCTWIYRK